MKRIIVLLISILSLVNAKDIQVLETMLIQSSSQGERYFPSFTKDGQYILFTSSGYNGLWSYDLSNKKTIKLTETTGAGYNPVSTANGIIIYRQDEYVNNLKYTSYLSLDSKSGEETLISNPGRFVSTPSLTGGQLHFMENNEVKFKRIDNNNSVTSISTDIALLNDNLKIQLIINGEVTILSPKGKGNYIWAELSPSKDQILFTKTGDGTYICNLNGEIITELGHASAPKWSSDGQFILYMKDFDDGEQYTDSEIWVSSSGGEKSWKITDTPDRIEMYPQWSPDNLHVVYQSDRGEIYLTEIRIVE